VSEGRRRRHKGRRQFVWPAIGLALVAVLLIVNLTMGLPEMGSIEALKVFTPARMRWIGVWAALLPAGAAGALGVYWAHEAFSRSERSAFLWLRRAFIASLASWAALIVVIMDDQVFPSRTAVAIGAAALFSANAIPFALAARAASGGRYGGGASGGGGRGKQRRRSSSEGPEEVGE